MNQEPLQPKKILIADDDDKLRMLLSEILTANGYDVLEASDGMQALDLIHRETVDLLITDRAMPRLNGLELLKKLQEEGRDLAALMISAYGDDALWASAIGLGAEDYLLKPFSTQNVLKVVRQKLS